MTPPSANDSLTIKEQWTQSLHALFPSLYALDEFERDNPGMLHHFLPPLHQIGLIRNDTQTALKALIQSSPPSETDAPRFNSFEDFLQQSMPISLSELAKQLNGLITELGLQPLFNNKKIGSAMFSRLKTMPADTTIKRNYLRILAFYMAWHRWDSQHRLDYEQLLALCTGQPREKGSHGIRIGFSINVIDISAFKWLRRLLKTCMARSSTLASLKITPLNSRSMFALYVDIPNKTRSSRISDKTPYGPGMREAISLAHQVLIQWQLSAPNQLLRPNLVIGIMAGNFPELSHLRQALNISGQIDFPQIRITQFARKCLMENNVRVTLDPTPQVLQIPNERPMMIWTVNGLWSWMYIQIIEEMIQSVEDAPLESITLPNRSQPVRINATLKSAIQQFYHDTENALLGLEIAKIFYYRKDLLNAIEILQAILRENPYQINALTMKMSIFYSQAAGTENPHQSELLFHRAEDIADRIFHLPDCHEEDAFNEIGQGYLARAILFLRQNQERLMKKTAASDDFTPAIDYLIKAEKAFVRGASCISTGHRSMFFILINRILISLFRSGTVRITRSNIVPEDPSIFEKTAFHLFQDAGWLPLSQPAYDFSGLEVALMTAVESFGDSVRLQCFKANTNLGLVILLHDLDLHIFPEDENRRLLKHWMNEALEWARINESSGLHTYTFSRRGYGELLTYKELEAHIAVWMDIVENKKDEKLIFANMFK
ncbi:MAG: hypothetical protein SWH61_02085 [Thermodesulfobacteriota bacterium]|nr:hypothetical protein [Thermodesulfobacteriota bacterium]